MNIGAAAAASRVNAKMTRYYESIGLLRPAVRRGNSYREFGPTDIHELRFAGRARSLGFSVGQIGALLSLWRDRERSSGEVREIASRHLAAPEARLADLQGMTGVLRQLVDACHGDQRPDCPILESLATSG